MSYILHGKILSSINEHSDRYNLLAFIREQDPPRGGWIGMHYKEMNVLYEIFMKNNIAVCVPTFHEKDHVFLFLESLNSLQYNFKEVLIVNGDYGDETSDLINECKSYMNLNIKEIPGKKNELWRGTVNRGLNKILIEYGSNIDILLCNIDIIFEDSTIDNLLNSSKILGRRNIIGAVGIYKDKVFCSGVKVKSWLFPIRNLHPFENILREELDNCDYAYVDFLPCRCIFIPSDVNLLIDSISYKKLA